MLIIVLIFLVFNCFSSTTLNIMRLVMNSQNPPELQAFASCLNSEAKFNYTIAFLLLPLVFYLTEFLMLRPEYEPTGLRQRIIVSKTIF